MPSTASPGLSGVYAGEKPSFRSDEHAAYVQRTIPDVRSEVVPDAGHTSNMENPDGFNREVASFLSAVVER